MAEPLATDEKDLLLRLRDGDETAFTALYHKYKRRIFYNLKKLVRIEDVAAELHQDIFLKLWEYRSQIDPEKSVEAFLVKVGRNVAIDFYRKAERDRSLQDQLVATMTELHNPVSDFIDYIETNAQLENAISKLPTQRQKVFRLIKLENKTYEYAANHFGVSVGTIKDHMAKATRFLQNELASSSPLLLWLAISAAILTE